jgi:hypothetical protein
LLSDPVIRVKEAVLLFTKLRGVVVKESASVLDILIATGLSRKLFGSEKEAEVADTTLLSSFRKLHSNGSGGGYSANSGISGVDGVAADENKQQAEAEGEVGASVGNDIGVSWDMSCLNKLMDYEDFTFAICKVIMSDLWLIQRSSSSSAQRSVGSAADREFSTRSLKSPTLPDDEEGGLGGGDDSHRSTKQRISHYLSAWLHSYESQPLPL